MSYLTCEPVFTLDFGGQQTTMEFEDITDWGSCKHYISLWFILTMIQYSTWGEIIGGEFPITVNITTPFWPHGTFVFLLTLVHCLPRRHCKTWVRSRCLKLIVKVENKSWFYGSYIWWLGGPKKYSADDDGGYPPSCANISKSFYQLSII